MANPTTVAAEIIEDLLSKIRSLPIADPDEYIGYKLYQKAKDFVTTYHPYESYDDDEEEYEEDYCEDCGESYDYCGC